MYRRMPSSWGPLPMNPPRRKGPGFTWRRFLGSMALFLIGLIVWGFWR